MMSIKMNKILTTRKVAQELGVSQQTIIRYIRDKRLKAHKLGGNGHNRRHWRIREADLEEFLTLGEQSANLGENTERDQTKIGEGSNSALTQGAVTLGLQPGTGDNSSKAGLEIH